MRAPMGSIGFLFVILVGQAIAQNPCAGPHARALVLGGGGSKGAFEAGAAYHFIVHRGCDFAEFSGTSVGALNGAVLAQAASSLDPRTSLANLQAQTEALVAMWGSIKSSNDVVRGRPLASLRFGLFGMEALKNFAPLRKLLARNVDPERLDDGRELRIGTVSFHDGRYHELVLNANGKSDPRTRDFLLASATIPMFAAMPRINAEETGESVQFGDGGLRHNAPIRSYFVQCAAGASPMRCRSAGNHGIPSHHVIEQLFVITTNPYDPAMEATPVWEPSVFKRGTHHITDGRKAMARAVSVMMDSTYHDDLDSVLFANELLRWRRSATAAAPPGALEEGFPLESYNFDPQRPDAASQPYQIGIVTPAVGDAGLDEILSFSPERIAKQMYCGCLAADEMLQRQFSQESMKNACVEKFQARSGRISVPDCRSRIVESLWRNKTEATTHIGTK